MYSTRISSYPVENVVYCSETKLCARQIVKESFDRVLGGTFNVPSLEEMELILKKNFEQLFDEYQAIQRIEARHPRWTETQMSDELERQRMLYENELRCSLRVAAIETIEEIENLIASFNQTIKDWKILNL